MNKDTAISVEEKISPAMLDVIVNHFYGVEGVFNFHKNNDQLAYNFRRNHVGKAANDTAIDLDGNVETVVVLEKFSGIDKWSMSDFMEGNRLKDLVLPAHHEFIINELARQKDAFKVIEVDAHLDLETSMFNKVYQSEDGLGHGAKDGAIFEIAIRLTSSDKFVNDVVNKHQFSSYIREFIYVQTPDNLKFQLNTGFAERYKVAIEKGNYDSLEGAETKIVDMLASAMKELGRELEPYKFYNKVKIRLTGKSTSFDLDFLQQKMPRLSIYFSHELKDLSAVKNFWREVNPKFFIDKTKVDHFALADVNQTIKQQILLRTFHEYIHELTGGVNTLAEVNDALHKLLSEFDEDKAESIKNSFITDIGAEEMRTFLK